MVTAQEFKKKSLVAITLLGLALTLPKSVGATAGSPQICNPGQTCTIGEFLYDDTYTPITTADICDLTVKNPDGSAYLTDQNMPPAAQSDGWYSYEFTTPSTTGYYRAEVCCTVNSEPLCVDKSFESRASSSAPSADSVASAVWGY